MDWMALDSAAALAIVCHTLEELWDVEWRDSLSDSDNIIAYAWGKKERLGKWRWKALLLIWRILLVHLRGDRTLSKSVPHGRVWKSMGALFVVVMMQCYCWPSVPRGHKSTRPTGPKKNESSYPKRQQCLHREPPAIPCASVNTHRPSTVHAPARVTKSIPACLRPTLRTRMGYSPPWGPRG